MSAPSLSQSSAPVGNSPIPSSKIFRSLKQSFALGSQLSAAPDTVAQNSPVVQNTVEQTTQVSPTLDPQTQNATQVQDPQQSLDVVVEQPQEPVVAPQLDQVPVEFQQPEPIVQIQPEPVSTEPAAPVEATTDTLNVPYAGSSTAKEVAPGSIQVTVENPVVDAAGGVQYVETDKAHELEMPPEVEGFLKTVENHHDQVPQEIVIANPQTGESLPRVMAQPVVVLPITAKLEKEGKWKRPTYSVRWLIEWSWKVMKMFSGKVIYRNAELA